MTAGVRLQLDVNNFRFHALHQTSAGRGRNLTDHANMTSGNP
jgi:hypothetical protein